MKEPLNFLAASLGGVIGRQTVPRAETQSLIEAARLSKGRAKECYVDARYVTRLAKPPCQSTGANADLWQEWEDLGRTATQPLPTPTWVKSHQDRTGFGSDTPPGQIYATT